MATFYATEGGNGVGSVGDPFGPAELFAWMDGTANAGDDVKVAAGTYTLAGNLDASDRDGANTSVIQLSGYTDETWTTKATYNDGPTFVLGAYSVTIGDFWKIIGIQSLSNNAAAIWTLGASTGIRESTITNGAGRALTLGLAGIAEECACSGVGNTAIYGATYSRVLNCYLYGSTTGHALGTTSRIAGSILYNNTTHMTSGSYADISGNLLHTGTTGISGNSTAPSVTDNDFQSLTTGFSQTTAGASAFVNRNNFYGVDMPYSGVTAGDDDTAVDPGYVDLAAGNPRPTRGLPSGLVIPGIGVPTRRLIGAIQRGAGRR